jgi:serine/threonine-protein kinase
VLTRLGRYDVDRKLADGGMGSVYLGRSPDGERVVLKVPHAQDRDSSLALADEARAGARLKHPAIVETVDFFVDKGISVLVVAYIEGKSLFDLRPKAGPLSGPAVAEIGVAIASALDAIHSAKDDAGQPLHMIHRDVGPNNVIVDTVGAVRLIDLGIVRSSERKQKATMQGMVKGTLRYLAPEILGGADHSPATDLFALGMTLWESALGRYAIPGDEMNGVRAAVDGSLYQRLADSRIDGALIEAVAALIAPVEQRLRNARAAGAVFSRLVSRYASMGAEPGTHALARAVSLALSSTSAVGLSPSAGLESATAAPAPEPTDVTDRREISAEASAPTMLSSRGDIESVFTSTSDRAALPTLQIPAAQPLPAQPAPITLPPSPPPLAPDFAPTIQMPVYDAPAARNTHHVDAMPSRSFDDEIENAPTIQMGAWTPASGPAAASKPGVDAGAPTSLAMPRTEPVVAAPPPATTPSGPPVVTPANAATPPIAPKVMKPAASLFLPIVVVDEDGEEIG